MVRRVGAVHAVASERVGVGVNAGGGVVGVVVGVEVVVGVGVVVGGVGCWCWRLYFVVCCLFVLLLRSLTLQWL